MGTGTAYSTLPTKKDDLVDVLDRFTQQAEDRYRMRFTSFMIYMLYLSGHRDFRKVNLVTGTFEVGNISEQDGRFQYKHKYINAKFNDLHARMMSLDFSPLVMTEGTGLSAVREKAAAQIILDYLTNPRVLEKRKASLITNLLVYGSCGLCAQPEEHPVLGYTADYEVVPPWEIFPFPHASANLGSVNGVMRRRFVSMDYVEERFGKEQITANRTKLDSWQVDYGYLAEHSNLGTVTDLLFQTEGLGRPLFARKQEKGAHDRKPTDTLREIVEMREIWLDGPHGTCSRYVVQLGSYIPIDKKMEDVYYCPIQFARFKENGDWYGEGLVGLLLGLHRETERMYSKLFDYVQTLDKFGWLFLPQGQFDVNTLIETPFGFGVGFYEPDVYGTNARPIHVQPNTPGDFPGRVAAMGTQMMEAMAPTPEILEGQAPGRVDNLNAMLYLTEQAHASVSTASAALAAAKGECDRSLVQQMAQKMTKEMVIPITRMDISLLGAVVQDPKTMFQGGGSENLGIRFDKNPIPDPSRLIFTIKQSSPKLRAGRKQEVERAFAEQRISEIEYRLINVKENLGLPMETGQLENTRRTAVLQAVVLFNDGVTPGPILDNNFGGLPEVKVMVFDEVMAMPEFLLASEAVVKAFVSYKSDKMRLIGQTLPGSTPPVDEAAVIFQRGEQMLAQLQQRAQQTQ